MFGGCVSADVDFLMDTAEAAVINLSVLPLSRRRREEAGLCLDEMKLDYVEVMLTLAVRTHSQTCSHDVRHPQTRKISTSSVSRCPMSTCQFPVPHGCPFHCHMQH